MLDAFFHRYARFSSLFAVLIGAAWLAAGTQAVVAVSPESYRESAAVSQDDQAVAQFNQISAAFKTLTDKADEIIERFEAATADDQKQAIREEYAAHVKEIEKLLPQLRAATMAAYRAVGEQNAEVADTMLRMAGTDMEKEDYLGILEITQPLIENGNESQGLYTVAGMGAYGTNQFELAKQYWAKAQARGTLPPSFQNYVGQLDGLIESFQEEQRIRADEAAANDLPRVALDTNKGRIVVELFENQAPGAVGNFVSLVEQGYYDGLTFHRVLPRFMAQGGCPDGTGSGGPGYKIYCECDREDYRHHFAGTLSMAHAGKDTGGSQFFLTFLPTTHLDGRHTAFGRVIDGWEVMSQLQRIDPRRPDGSQPDVIEKATVLRKRDHVYEPNKVQ